MLKSLIESLHLPTLSKKELTAHYLQWSKDYKQDMSFPEYLSSIGIPSYAVDPSLGSRSSI